MPPLSPLLESLIVLQPHLFDRFWLRRLLIPVILAGLPTTVLAEEPLSVVVFTDSLHFPIRPTDNPALRVTLYDLAAPKLAMATMNAQMKLPANPALAAELAKTYLQSHQAELAQRILPTYQGLSQALNWGISRYPALVFNGEAVIYGVTDLQQGLKIYRQWQDDRGSP